MRSVYSRCIRRAWLTLLAISLGLALLSTTPDARSRANRQAAATGNSQQTDWSQVDRLVADQKFAEALAATEKLRRAAQAAGNQDEWTRALIKEVQLRTGLHGYETAVRFLKEQPWPKGTLDRAALNLYYARALMIYYRSYSWEINQRERVESKETVDLKSWTRDQIHLEAQKAFSEVWNQRAALGAQPISRLAEYLDRNTYPDGIRSTLRDAVSYLYAELLTDSALWGPAQSNELYRLNLTALLAPNQSEIALLDPAIHPLAKACAILADLERWHSQSRRPEAALEARLQRLKDLHESLTEARDRAAIEADLEKLLPEYRKVPWWAMGKALQAEFALGGAEPGKNIRARSLAEAGWKAYPATAGGRRCESIAKSIEAPEFSLTSVSADGLGKRSMEVSHKNLRALYFRAYALDLERQVRTARDYNLLPNPQEQLKIIDAQRPVAEWSTDLPATPDYELHRTFIVPPMKAPGCYVVAASVTKAFSKAPGNRLVAATVILSDLVLLTISDPEGGVEVRSLSGSSGRPLAGVEVDLYRNDWQKGHTRLTTTASDGEGRLRFVLPRDGSMFFLFAKRGPDVALHSRIYNYRTGPQSRLTASFIYTDRSVYRPMQEILWKVLAYGGDAEGRKFHTVPSTQVMVSLIDPNGQKVEQRSVATNAYGSAAGEFTIPAGRLLGNWRLESSLNGRTEVKVEEYKRPTFEVTLPQPKSALRMNRPATLTGEARYYFGLPVTAGSVNWHATRAPVFPVRWSWYRGGGGGRETSQIVARGNSALQADGTFEITFTPEADERLAADSKETTYAYRVVADVVDEGGETRSAALGFRLGFVSIEADIRPEAGFFREQAPGAIEVVRTDLNGVPRAGEGTWRLVALQQPARTSLPADMPVLFPAQSGTGAKEYRTPGDLMRPRWDPQYSASAAMHEWADGAEMSNGKLAHGIDGVAKLDLPALAAGAYRIYYRSVDDFGTAYQASDEFVVSGERTRLALPALLLAEQDTERVGDTARFLALSGLPNQPLFFEIWRNGRMTERRSLDSGQDATLIEIPVREEDRGGFSVRLSALRDFQFMDFQSVIRVPWDNKQLKVEFATFRDKLRPGATENWRVTVKGPAGANVEAGAAELLAYMYDKSLDVFAPHNPPDPLRAYMRQNFVGPIEKTLGPAYAQILFNNLSSGAGYAPLLGDRLKFYDNYGIGGPGQRYRAVGGMAGGAVGGIAPAAMPAMERADVVADASTFGKSTLAADSKAPPQAETQLRADFAETAFWKPHLLIGADGSATIEFTVPDSVTSWNVWVHAVTRDLMAGSVHKEAQSVKELMVRPYVPRFLREGDRAELKVVVNNAADRPLEGNLKLDILDPESNESLSKSFGLENAATAMPFRVAAGKGTSLTFPITVPARVGLVAFKVIASAGDISDGELRPLPVLPGRMHLSQSRFVTLKNRDRREMTFSDLKKGTDPTLINEQMVITLDAQLFYSVLSALPYLVNYPYECTEQTLNRFVSTGILTGLYKNYPAVARMAAEFSKRTTPLETWDAADPNRKMALEETPWLVEAKGGTDYGYGMTNVLDPRIAQAERESAIAKLRKAQAANGAFPWWPGGPPSPYMTLYILSGLAKAVEFGVDVPQDMVQRAWGYVAQHFHEQYAGSMLKDNCCWEFLTYVNYVASCFQDPAWMGNALTPKERQDILNHCFAHWKEHSPYLKCQLALTLKRMGRTGDGALVFASVMDSARTTPDEGTFWAQEDRSWLWYNDTIETHAFALRTLMELTPQDTRKDGLVQWLFLNKKLNHWKSTRATSEVIYSIVHYLKAEGTLAAREDATVQAGGQTIRYVFEPDQYTGKKNQTVIPGDKLGAGSATVVVEKESPGFVFASATWQFSTEQLPQQGSGDFLSVSRTYFKRENAGAEFVLKPLAEGTVLQAGDEVEVQVSIRANHPCEYVHLRDPRAAGFEPVRAESRFRWDLGIGWYEEVRDSGTNFYFEQLPQGEYTLRYRLRASMAGTFKVAPATLQSMYAPEFTAYSAGSIIRIK